MTGKQQNDEGMLTRPPRGSRKQQRGLSWLKTLGLVALFVTTAGGQEIGVEICSCAPGTYEFTLDFSLFCPPVNITVGDAVAATSCMVSPFGNPEVSDLIPVAVQSIDILELNQNLQISVQENIAGSFGDGDTFRYTSIAALPGQIVDPVDLPRAIQINIVGVNALDEPIINAYLITFTNNCGKFPVLFEGQYAGWTRFSDLTPPLQDVCPFGTEFPTAPPSIAPSTPAPTVAASTVAPVTSAPTPSPLDMSMSLGMSMSMSMSMDLDLNMEFDMMDSLDEMVEFGRTTKTRMWPYNKNDHL